MLLNNDKDLNYNNNINSENENKLKKLNFNKIKFFNFMYNKKLLITDNFIKHVNKNTYF